jgi:hypothetical protein
VKVTFTLRDVSNWIYAYERFAEVYTNPDAIQAAKKASDGLQSFFDFHVRTGCPMDAEFIASERYIQ